MRPSNIELLRDMAEKFKIQGPWSQWLKSSVGAESSRKTGYMYLELNEIEWWILCNDRLFYYCVMIVFRRFDFCKVWQIIRKLICQLIEIVSFFVNFSEVISIWEFERFWFKILDKTIIQGKGLDNRFILLCTFEKFFFWQFTISVLKFNIIWTS